MVDIRCDVIDCKIPLLLSRDALGNADTKLHFKSGVAFMLNQKINLKKTSSGHFMIKLFDNKAQLNKVFLTNSPSQHHDLSVAKKLHSQFGHARAEKIIEVIEDSQYHLTQNLRNSIKEVCATCTTCALSKKPKPRPVVGLPFKGEFNRVVSIDLKDIRGKNVFIL